MRSVRLLATALLLGLAAPSGAMPGAAVAAAPQTADPADAAARRFLDEFVDADGRVVRRDQGGDTVGEGQAYALLIAAAIGDEATFRSVWTWTGVNLIGEDGLLALRWDRGIVDAMPATDADLITAGALALGAERFGDPELAAAALRLGARVLRLEVAGTAVVAGPWALDPPVVNPSYLVFPAMSWLWHAGQREWAAVAATSRGIVATLVQEPPHLPPDWATLNADGVAAPAPSPSGASPRYGYEAVRVLVQLAADCDPGSRDLAASAWPFFRDQDRIVAVYALDGTPLAEEQHPAALVAAAAAARATGDADASTRLLDRADELVTQHPTYYGSAWAALGRLWLETDLLGDCPS